MLPALLATTTAAQTAIQILANAAEVTTSAVSLTLTAGSVIVTADIFFGTQEGANFAASECRRAFLALETALNANCGGRPWRYHLCPTPSTLPQAVVVAPSPPPRGRRLRAARAAVVWPTWRRCRRCSGHPRPRLLPSEAQQEPAAVSGCFTEANAGQSLVQW